MLVLASIGVGWVGWDEELVCDNGVQTHLDLLLGLCGVGEGWVCGVSGVGLGGG